MRVSPIASNSPARPSFAAPALVAVVALAARLPAAWQYGDHPLGRLPWVDEAAYLLRALAIASGQFRPQGPFYQDPLWPYLLAIPARLFGPDLPAIRLAMAAVGSITPVLVWAAGRRALGRAEGLVAGLLAALCGPLVFTDMTLEKEGTAALVAAASLLLSARGGPASAFGSGLAWGLHALLRSNALLFGPLVPLWWLVAPPAPTTAGRRAARALASAAGFALALAPIVAWNASCGPPGDRLWLTTWQAGPNFFIGNRPGASGTYDPPSFVEPNPAFEADDFRREADRRSGRALAPAAVSRYWMGEGQKFWRDRPAEATRLLGRKFALVTADTEIPDNQDPQVVRLVAAPWLAAAPLGFGALLTLSAAGLAARLPPRPTPHAPHPTLHARLSLVAVVAIGLGSTALFFVVGRYRVPWLPALALLAGAGAIDLARAVADRQARPLAIAAVLGSIVAAIAWWPRPDPAPDRWGHAQIQLAIAALDAGGPWLDRALDALDDARALGPGPAARVEALVADGPIADRLRAAVATRLDAASRLGPVAPATRARLLRQIPALRPEARRILDEALSARPDDPALRRESGSWWLTAASAAEAEAPAGSWPIAATGLRGRAAADWRRAAPAGDRPAALLLALIGRDPAALPTTVEGLDPARVRLARAIIRPSSRSSPPSG